MLQCFCPAIHICVHSINLSFSFFLFWCFMFLLSWLFVAPSVNHFIYVCISLLVHFFGLYVALFGASFSVVPLSFNLLVRTLFSDTALTDEGNILSGCKMHISKSAVRRWTRLPAGEGTQYKLWRTSIALQFHKCFWQCHETFNWKLIKTDKKIMTC